VKRSATVYAVCSSSKCWYFAGKKRLGQWGCGSISKDLCEVQ